MTTASGSPDPGLVADLDAALGAGGVVTDPDLTLRHRSDWTGRFVSEAPVVVARPASTAEVAAVVGICAERRVAIVPQGGNTGLVGGSVPLHGELVLSTERLVGVTAVDAVVGQLTAAAGSPLAVVQQAAADAGWRYGVDIASRDTATIGGTVATNAGGLHVVRHGATRAQVTGMTFVDGLGQIHRVGAATLRDNTGYDLIGLLCGSEGTLGVVTEVRLRLVPDPEHRTVALLRFDDEAAALVAVEALRWRVPALEAAEFFLGAGLELVCATFDLPAPFATTSGGYVLVEVADTVDRTGALADAVADLGTVTGVGPADVAVADDTPGRARLWRYRERHTEAISTVGVPHKLDVAVPAGTLAAFVGQVPATVRAVAPDAQVWLFGHGGEASVHVNVTADGGVTEAVDDAVLGLVADLGGSISAEHGIGTAKRAWLGRTTPPQELALRRRIGDAFDPYRIMNPAVLTAPG